MKKKSLLVLFFLIIFTVGHYRINAMPKLYEAPVPTFNLYPYKNDSIGVIHENIEYVIPSGEPLYSNQISYLKEDYTLKNVSSKQEEIIAAFITRQSKVEDVNVIFNGEKMEVTRVRLDAVRYEGEGFTVIDDNLRKHVLGSSFKFSDVVSAINNKLNKYAETGEAALNETPAVINLMFFKLSFEPNSIKELHISRKSVSGYFKKKSGTVMRCTYEHLLDPARYWESFSDLDVTIKVPNDFKLQYVEEDTLLKDLNKVEDGVYKKHFTYLPSKQIELSVAPVKYSKDTSIFTSIIMTTLIVTGIIALASIVYIIRFIRTRS